MSQDDDILFRNPSASPERDNGNAQQLAQVQQVPNAQRPVQRARTNAELEAEIVALRNQMAEATGVTQSLIKQMEGKVQPFTQEGYDQYIKQAN